MYDFYFMHSFFVVARCKHFEILVATIVRAGVVFWIIGSSSGQILCWPRVCLSSPHFVFCTGEPHNERGELGRGDSQ